MDLTRASRFLSLIPPHEPEKFGVMLDGAGWTEVDALLEACRRHGRAMDRATLEQVVARTTRSGFRSTNKVWLVDHVPARFIRFAG